MKNARNKYARSTGAYKLPKGKTTIRILQRDPNAVFWRDSGQHWIKTEKNGKPVAVTGCKHAIYGKPCEICTAIDAAMKSASDDESLAIMKEWNVKKGVLVEALIRSGADASEEPQVLELTPTTFSTILGIADEFNEEYGNIFDLDTGMDLVIDKTGAGLDTKYAVYGAPKSKPVPAAARKNVIDLEEWIQKEYFKGDEPKALNAIVSMSGISLPNSISGRTSKLLTSAGAKVADEEELIVPGKKKAAVAIEDQEQEVLLTPKSQRAKVTPAEDVEVTQIIEAENEAAPAPAPKPAAKAAPAPAAKKDDDFGAPLAAEDIDDILGDLDGMTAK